MTRSGRSRRAWTSRARSTGSRAPRRRANGWSARRRGSPRTARTARSSRSSRNRGQTPQLQTAIKGTDPSVAGCRQGDWPLGGAAGVELQQPDPRLGVLDRAEQVLQAVERPAHDLDALVLVRLGVLVVQGGREIEVDLLVEDPHARPERAERLPVLGALADLLGELAPAGLQRRLARLVELARRDLEHVGVVDRLARLPDEPEVLVVVADDPDCARVADDVALDLLAVGVAIAVVLDPDEVPLVDGLA